MVYKLIFPFNFSTLKAENNYFVAQILLELKQNVTFNARSKIALLINFGTRQRRVKSFTLGPRDENFSYFVIYLKSKKMV